MRRGGIGGIVRTSPPRITQRRLIQGGPKIDYDSLAVRSMESTERRRVEITLPKLSYLEDGE